MDLTRPELAQRSVRELTRAALTSPAVPILLLAASVQVVRQAWVDFAVFVASAAVIRWDERRWGRVSVPPEPPPLRRVTVLGLGVAVVGYAIVVGGLPRADAVTSLALGLPGLGAAALVLLPLPGTVPARTVPTRTASAPTTPAPTRDTTEPAPPGRGRFAWVGVFLALALLELSAFLAQPAPRVDDPNRPTISDLVEPHLDSAAVRAVVIVGWLVVGVWLVRRLRAWAGAADGARPPVAGR